VKLLLDQGVPRTAAEALGRLGFEVVHTGTIGMAKATDEDILDRARRERETVVTLYPIGQRRPRRPLTRTAIGC